MRIAKYSKNIDDKINSRFKVSTTCRKNSSDTNTQTAQRFFRMIVRHFRPLMKTKNYRKIMSLI